MRNRETAWLATAVVGVLLCGVALGVSPGGHTLLPLRQILAQYEDYDVSIVFPMWEANNIYVASPWGQNTTFLPVRADAQPVSVTDYVTFWTACCEEFDVDDEQPFIGHLPDINLLIDDSYLIGADALYTNGLVIDDWFEINVDGLPDADENGVPEGVSGFNDPFAFPAPSVYVGQVPSADEASSEVVFTAVGSVGLDTMALTAEVSLVVTGSDVTLAVPSGAVPDTDGRIIVRTAASPADIHAELGDLPIPSGEGVVPVAAIDAHMVDSTGAEVDEVDAPIEVRVPIVPVPGEFTDVIDRIGIPVFYAETDLDTDYNVILAPATMSFAQLAVEQTVENNELVFEIDHLTTYVPMFHTGAPVILGIEPYYGPLEGGTAVNIAGAGYLDENLTVTFGGLAATGVDVVYHTAELMSGTISCVTPAYPTSGPVDVRVTNPEDDQGYALFAILEDAFWYNVGTFEPDWDGPGEGVPGGGRGGSGPCFIATAAYGSHAAHELETLRTFRDNYLLTNAVGIALVRTYYRHSPPLAKFIARYEFARKAVRAALSPLVLMADEANNARAQSVPTDHR